MRYYSKRFTVYFYPRSLDSISILHLIVHRFNTLWSILARRHFRGTHMPHQATNNVHILLGTHLYTWVESSDVDKVSCWRTKVPGIDGNPESRIHSNIPLNLHILLYVLFIVYLFLYFAGSCIGWTVRMMWWRWLSWTAVSARHWSIPAWTNPGLWWSTPNMGELDLTP